MALDLDETRRTGVLLVETELVGVGVGLVLVLGVTGLVDPLLVSAGLLLGLVGHHLAPGLADLGLDEAAILPLEIQPENLPSLSPK